MSGQNNFIARAMCLFVSMDKMLGGEFEQGLAQMKSVAEAAKTVRGMKWARVGEMELELEGTKVKSYRVTVRIYFDIER